jgi:hypothetical protein
VRSTPRLQAQTYSAADVLTADQDGDAVPRAGVVGGHSPRAFKLQQQRRWMVWLLLRRRARKASKAGTSIGTRAAGCVGWGRKRLDPVHAGPARALPPAS